MFTIVLVGLLSAMASCSASACWLSQSVIWNNKPLSKRAFQHLAQAATGLSTT